MRKIDIEVYDDFVSPTYLKAIQDATDPEGTPWFFQGSQSLSRYDDSNIEDFGFSIGLLPPWKPNEFENSRLADLIRPLIYQVTAAQMHRYGGLEGIAAVKNLEALDWALQYKNSRVVPEGKYIL